MNKSGSCNYFDREITDGMTSMRLLGLADIAAGEQRLLVEIEEKEQPTVLTKCEAKRSRQGSQVPDKGVNWRSSRGSTGHWCSEIGEVLQG